MINLNKRKIYLASPFFSEKETKIYKEVISILRSYKNTEVYVPQEHEIMEGHKMTNNHWGRSVFHIDKNALDCADIVFVLNFGMYSDSGTAWDAGYAYAKEKTVYQILCGDKNAEYSLMMANGTTYVLTLEDLRKNKLPNQLQVYENFTQ